MIKKLLCCVAIIATLSTNAFAQFSDIDGIGEKTAIENLYSKGIVEGTSETTYSPNDNLTRAQFAAFCVRMFNISDGKGIAFSDVEEGSWYEEYVNKASCNGYINGYNGLFRPNDCVTHEEAAKILICAFEKNVETLDYSLSFSSTTADVLSVSPWAREYVGKALMLGILPYTMKEERLYDLSIKPQSYTTRAEAAQMIDNLLKVADVYKSKIQTEEDE